MYQQLSDAKDQYGDKVSLVPDNIDWTGEVAEQRHGDGAKGYGFFE